MADSDKTAPEWAVLTDDEVEHIACFASVTEAQIRGIEMLVLLKAGYAKVGS